MLTLAYPDEQSRLVEHLGRDAFLAALDNPDIELRIRECEPQSLDAAVRLAQRFEIYRDVVGTAQGRSRQYAARQVVDETTADKKVDPLSTPEFRIAMDAAAERALAACNLKKDDNVSTLGRESVASKSSNSGQVGSGNRSTADGSTGRKARKFSRAVGQGRSAEPTSAVAARPPVTPPVEQQLQNLQAEMAKMAKELSQFKSQQQVPMNLQSPQRAPRGETRFYHRSSGGGNSEPNPNSSFNRGYSNSNFGYNTGQAAVNSGRVIGQSQSRCCWNCNSPQHFARNCPFRQYAVHDVQPVSGNMAPAQINGTVRSGISKPNGHATYLKATVNGVDCSCLLDTGSEVTVIPSSVVEGCNLRPTQQTLRAANGSAIPVLGEATVSFETLKYKSTITGLVKDHVEEVMLGISWYKCKKQSL